ncbi:FtsX-like permease family protein [Paraburkholderia rhizosphaerae]|uniref:Putative ABC transport system permease protein n=1 Tax=Paraburkholderia rhizosphaerae TaxID=480658 RepID=A0A4R8M303_9BURK|nr:FtsX-like permease family protein [Paraburkholderia rhizosphaerae]TDY53954.1 putative ABC transport system permease protein [Paraburkholderia rhizosphaerae]
MISGDLRHGVRASTARSSSARAILSTAAALIAGESRSHPLRALVAVLAIAAGVAMGYAVQLINGAALTELASTVNSLMGNADLEIRGPRTGFDESLYPRIARLADVAAASPVVEVDARIAGRGDVLKLLGVDVFHAGRVTPDLVGRVDNASADRLNLLAPDTVFLSPAALAWTGLKVGDTLTVQVGLRQVALHVAGTLPASGTSVRVGVMDIGAAQWQLERLGTLQRIDIKLKAGVDADAFARQIAAQLPAGVTAVDPRDNAHRTSQLSRAYRANLNVLALVALFTGAFLVFTIQALAALRRRTQFALLRALGVTRRGLVALIVAEGALLGVLGALTGVALGYAVAAAVLHFAGGDLGGGYFEGVRPRVHFDAAAACLFVALGIAAAVLGSIAPALEAARAQPAQALKAGDEETHLKHLHRARSLLGPLVAIGLAVAAARVPAVNGLPLFGYVAVALLLIGGVLAMPYLARTVFDALPRTQHALPQLALAQLAHAPGRAAIGPAGIVASFSLMVAMAIMVSSFRIAVDDWLQLLLPAPLYLRAAPAGDSGFLSESDQATISATPGIARAEFLRSTQITLDMRLPPVALIARPIDPGNPAARLPLTGAPRVPGRDTTPPAWVSEAMADLYRLHVGNRIALPVGGQSVRFVVSGIWRDYARQFGAVVIDEADYRKLTNDTRATDAALWPAHGVTAAQAAARIRERVAGGDRLSFSEPGEIRAASLKIFDRSFAVTYLLEAVAVLIGLFGIGASFGAQALSRTREFGVLRHLGVTRGQIAALLVLEGALVALLGVAAGLVIGTGIAAVLVYVVNPQSFHWTMSLHMPWALVSILASSVVLAAAVTALWSARSALSVDAVRAVRDDW